MKWMIASDLHGSAYYCQQMLDAYQREGADRLLLLGDLLYHGPRNPFPKDYNTLRVTELLNSVKSEVLCVRGNCDSEVDQMVLEFPIMADYTVLPLLTSSGKNRTIFATHGHLYHEDALPPLQPGDILLHGHTHVPACIEHKNYLYLNPGSTSLPNQDSWHGYLILEDEILRWKDFDSQDKIQKEYKLL